MVNAVWSAHVALFGFGALGNFLGLWRARAIGHRETRYGLYGLLLTSGCWGLTYLGTFFTDSVAVATVLYRIGLIFGLSTVGAWLYFCSAYTGNDYHRSARVRRVALGVLLGISALKLTNSVHGLYFSLELIQTPFEYINIRLLELHWMVTVCAHLVAAFGFYLLFQLFRDSEVPTLRLAFLVSLTALPVTFNALSMVGVAGLVATNYEPVGVAAFALGVLYVANGTFERVRWAAHRQLLEQIDEAILITDDDGIVYEYNDAAEHLFTDVNHGEHIETIVPELADPPELDANDEWPDTGTVISAEQRGTTRYYLAHETDLTLGPHYIGRAFVLSDVTTVENQRRELKRQSEQLEGFAAAISHELRNTLTIISENTDLVAEALATEDIEMATDRVSRISDATGRMTDVIVDLTTLARLSKPVEQTDKVPFEESVQQAADGTATDAVSLTIEGQGWIEAEETRLIELFNNILSLASESDATGLRVVLTDDGFRCVLRGSSQTTEAMEGLFEYGTPVPHAAAGMLGPNIETLARAHGWTVAVEDSSTGLSISVTGADTRRSPPVQD